MAARPHLWIIGGTVVLIVIAAAGFVALSRWTRAVWPGSPSSAALSSPLWPQRNFPIRLKTHSGSLCLDDPGYSTHGTQLSVYTCKDGTNQRCSLP